MVVVFKFSILFTFILLGVGRVAIDYTKPLQKLTFGSCWGLFDVSSTIFEDIADEESDLWIWLGDAAYLDIIILPFLTFPSSRESVLETFRKTKAFPAYENLRTQTPIIGVWDDHDSNMNDGHKDNPNLDWVQKDYLNFLDEPSDSPRWSRKGVYGSWTIGEGTRSVKIILLDVRSRADLPEEPNADQLGDEQWQWLEEEMTSNTATFTLIGSGIQILPDDRFTHVEALYPNSRQRLFQLLAKYHIEGVILLSGDVHFGELLESPCPVGGMKYNLIELTSSGMSHLDTDHHPTAAYLHETFFPFTWKGSDPIYRLNYGVVEIDWESPDPALTLSIKTLKQEILLERTIKLSEISERDVSQEELDSCILKTDASRRAYDHVIAGLLVPRRLVYTIYSILFWPLLLFIIYLSIRFIVLFLRSLFCQRQKQKEQ